MNSEASVKFSRGYRGKRHRLAASVAAGCLSLLCLQAQAGILFQSDTTEVRWDNTFKYSAGMRLKDPSAEVLAGGAGPNGDDGDLNFGKHDLISNRLDVLSEFDVRYNDFGFRLSGAGWYDEVYNSRPANLQNPNFPFPTSNSGGRFPRATERLHGRHAETLDAFVYGTFDLGPVPTTLRAGRHTLLWGESLFMATNGIAAAMSPLNIGKGASVPNTPAKELFMPVNQVSLSAKILPNATLEAYVQLEWRGSRLPGAGAYFSDVDIYGPGGNVLLSPPDVPLWAPLTPLDRSDRNPSDGGQYGLALKYRSDAANTDFGFYYLRFHDKTSPVNFYLSPTGAPVGCAVSVPGAGCVVPMFATGEYGFLYGEDVKLYGISASTGLGDWSIGGEVSWREGEALRTATPALTAPDAGLLARGNTLHYQVSGIRMFGGTPLWDAAAMVFEVGGHSLRGVTRNRASLDPALDRSAFGGRLVFTPTYYRIAPGLDMDVPIGVGYSPRARSPLDNKFNMGGAHKGGDFSIGMGFTYRNTWKAGLGYTTYFGKVGDGQAFRDRDFVSLFVQTTL